MKKNLITVLKKLLTAFGGEETQSNNAVEIVDKIADSVEQGGGSGGGNFVIGFNMETRTFDKTWQEIHDAMSSGKLCVAVVQDQEMVNEIIAFSTGMDYESEDSSGETSASIPVYTVTFIDIHTEEVVIRTAKAKRTPSAYPAFIAVNTGPVPNPGTLDPTPGTTN